MQTADNTTSTTAAEDTTANANAGAPGADTNTAGSTEQEQAAPGGKKGEFHYTWTLHPITARTVAKGIMMIIGYVSLAYVVSLAVNAVAGTTSIFLALLVSVLAMAAMFFGTFLVVIPGSIGLVDFMFDKSVAGWNKVKGWFKKAEKVGEAAAAAAADAAAEPAPAAA